MSEFQVKTQPIVLETTKPKSPVIVFKITEDEKNILRFLKTNFPHTFNSDDPLPLAKNLHVSLKKVLTCNNVPFSSTQFYNAIKHWCSRLKYKQALIKYKYRYHIDGEPYKTGGSKQAITPQDKEDAEKAVKYYFYEQTLRNLKLREKKKQKDAKGFKKPFYAKKPSKPFTVEYKKSRQ